MTPSAAAPPKAPVDELTGLEAAPFGVYVHFPYCLSKCPYCDFASTAAKAVPEARYEAAVRQELSMRAPALAGRTVASVFFGGGTPSLWGARHVAAVLSAIRDCFPMAPGAEVTLEANPGAADAQRFEAYLEAGVNRLSMGVQSLTPKTLAALGRAHGPEEARAAVKEARRAGVRNLSLDFIYGVHGQSLETVKADAEEAAGLGTEHLSAYALTLDKESLAEEVPLAKQLHKGEVALPPDELVVAMQREVQRLYEAAGLRRYEVSNYAKPGWHSRHNALYWTGGEYLALGVGATGFWRVPEGGGVRVTNQRSAERYLAMMERPELPSANEERLDDAALFRERIAMGLRLTNGVDVAKACERFGQPFEARALALRQLASAGLLVLEGGRARLTSEGFDVHSAIAAKLM